MIKKNTYLRPQMKAVCLRMDRRLCNMSDIKPYQSYTKDFEVNTESEEME